MEDESTLEEKVDNEDLVLPANSFDYDETAFSSTKIKEETSESTSMTIEKDTLEILEEDDQNYDDNQELH